MTQAITPRNEFFDTDYGLLGVSRWCVRFYGDDLLSGEAMLDTKSKI
jgi:hypothetical protein